MAKLEEERETRIVAKNYLNQLLQRPVEEVYQENATSEEKLQKEKETKTTLMKELEQKTKDRYLWKI